MDFSVLRWFNYPIVIHTTAEHLKYRLHMVIDIIVFKKKSYVTNHLEVLSYMHCIFYWPLAQTCS